MEDKKIMKINFKNKKIILTMLLMASSCQLFLPIISSVVADSADVQTKVEVSMTQNTGWDKGEDPHGRNPVKHLRNPNKALHFEHVPDFDFGTHSYDTNINNIFFASLQQVTDPSGRVLQVAPYSCVKDGRGGAQDTSWLVDVTMKGFDRDHSGFSVRVGDRAQPALPGAALSVKLGRHGVHDGGVDERQRPVRAEFNPCRPFLPSEPNGVYGVQDFAQITSEPQNVFWGFGTQACGRNWVEFGSEQSDGTTDGVKLEIPRGSNVPTNIVIQATLVWNLQEVADARRLANSLAG